MARFKGKAAYSVDSKRRVAIPAKMRATIGDDLKHFLTVTRGFERCIYLYPLTSWKRLETAISELSPYDQQARAFVRRTMMWAEDAILDQQGRIALPKALTDYAEIEQKALILGAFDHIEIWNAEIFYSYLDSQSADYETLAAQVMGS